MRNQITKKGELIYNQFARDSTGRLCRAKVTSVKTWKTCPQVEVHWKYGLYKYGEIHNWHAPESAAWLTEVEYAVVKDCPDCGAKDILGTRDHKHGCKALLEKNENCCYNQDK